MNVGRDALGRQFQKFIPRQANWIFDQAPDFEIPGLGIERRHVSIVQDRKFLGEILSGWKAPLLRIERTLGIRAAQAVNFLLRVE